MVTLCRTATGTNRDTIQFSESEQTISAVASYRINSAAYLSMKLERLREILARAAGKRIAVAGDLMLDEFVWGKVGRISPEAPVPVVEVTGETFYPGRRGQRRAQPARVYRRRLRSLARSGPTPADGNFSTSCARKKSRRDLVSRIPISGRL